MLSSVYQNVINLVVCLSLRIDPAVFMNFAMMEHCTSDSQVFRCGENYYYNTTALLISSKLLFPTQFEDGFPAYFHIEITQ
jgi:hypothetical protein